MNPSWFFDDTLYHPRYSYGTRTSDLEKYNTFIKIIDSLYGDEEECVERPKKQDVAYTTIQEKMKKPVSDKVAKVEEYCANLFQQYWNDKNNGNPDSDRYSVLVGAMMAMKLMGYEVDFDASDVSNIKCVISNETN